MSKSNIDRQDQDLWERIRRIVNLMSPVLLEGESGTGKSTLARTLHHQSSRSEQPLKVMECVGLSLEEMDSLLFGHSKDEPGLLQEADKGTLILKNIDLLSLNVQDRLFRFLDEGSFIRRGEPGQAVNVNVRIVATTKKSIAEYQRQGLFHKRLFYRFKPCRFRIPALRKRPCFLRTMAHAYLDNFRLVNPSLPCADKLWSFHEEVNALFLAMHWPDNLHGLRSTVECIAQFGPEDKQVLALSDVIDVLLDPDFGFHESNTKSRPDDGNYLLSMLELTGWNVPLAGRITGYSRATIMKRMEEQRWQKP